MSQADEVDRMIDELDSKKRAPEIASDCFAADGGQSDVKALAGNPKRSADRPRRSLEEMAMFIVLKNNDLVDDYKDMLKELQDFAATKTAG